MSIRILPVTLLCCALALGLLSACCLTTQRRFERLAVRTTGRILSFQPFGGEGRPVPVVEFVDGDGKTQRRQAQSIGTGNCQSGDEVDILYTRRKLLGMDAWNVFVIAQEGARPYRVYSVAGIILAVIAVGLAAAGIIIWLR